MANTPPTPSPSFVPPIAVLTLGAFLIVGTMSIEWVDLELTPGCPFWKWDRTQGWGPFAAGIAGVTAGALWLARTAQRIEDQEVDFDSLLAHVGFALVVVGLLVFLGLFGLASRGIAHEVLGMKEADSELVAAAPAQTAHANPEQRPLPAGLESARESRPAASAPPTPALLPGGMGPEELAARRRQVVWGARIALLLGFGLMGSLFFVAGSLHDSPGRRELHDEETTVSMPRFWAGLWYRVGEGILFAIVALLAIQTGLIGDDRSWRWLLLLGMLMAMFVKPAEKLVNGLARRLFETVETATNAKLKRVERNQTDPLASVVQRLDSASELVRLQAVADLERLARGKYGQVVELLASHVRRPTVPPQPGEPLPADIQRAFTTLVSLRPPRGEDRPRISLRHARLRQLEAAQADLKHVDLTGADLSAANLSGADFSKAVVAGADFTESCLDRAQLESATGLDEASFELATTVDAVFPNGFDPTRRTRASA